MTQTKYAFSPDKHKTQLLPILKHIDLWDQYSEKKLLKILKKYPKKGKGYYSKNNLIQAFKFFSKTHQFKTSPKDFSAKLKKKPIRTMSGVTPLTVLTKPFPCPGKCIFCPNDVRMPKSYLADEPGAQRATRHAFDPYLQTYNRLDTFHRNGHSIDKVEIIVLGGTWSFYPEPYQIWYIKRCFDALNDYSQGIDDRPNVKTASDFKNFDKTIDGSKFDTTYNQVISKELTSKQSGRLLNTWETATWEQLEKAQQINQSAKSRCVGLVIETRPDNISPAEVVRIRRLGCTKTQIGFQSLNDHVLKVNKRGHDVAATRRAMKLLRLAGLKIHVHWMPNLYGSNPQKDIQDFKKIFSDLDFKPDELKIYPCSLIQSAELMTYYQKGLWQPYTHDQLLDVLTQTIKLTPRYCRLTRIIRDIPSTDIVAGNKTSNFRQIAEAELDQQKIKRLDIRSREIRNQQFDPNQIKLKTTTYQTSVSTEKFLEYITPDNQILGFLRLSLPDRDLSFWSEAIESNSHKDPISSSAPSTTTKQTSFIPELANSAIIREVHVYGTAANLGERSSKKAQHLGLGTKLINRAKALAKKSGYPNLAVISAIGTREYYAKLGFTQGPLYQHFRLSITYH